MQQNRPNILFLMSDEHRADVTGFSGNRVIRTPTLDWLAKTGTVFRNAYTPSPICIPCRQAMAAGQLPRTCGVEHFGQDLPPTSMTFAHRFSQYAYRTASVGKLHHTGRDQMQGWCERVVGDTHMNPAYLEGRNEKAFAALPPKEDGIGKWSDAKECIRAGTMPERGETLRTAGALEWINHAFADSRYDRAAPDHPTLLKVSYSRPHYPYFTMQDKFEYYLNRVEPFLGEEVFEHPFLSQRQVEPGVDASVREIRRATAAYYGMVEELDEDYGTLLNRLRHLGQDLDDWIIVYCSDHGEMLGQHGIWEKQKFFEASARVPLIIRWPRRFSSRTVDENVNLCDLFATLCDLSGLPLPSAEETVNGAGLDSRSLVQLMQGDTRDWHERYKNESISQFGGTNVMIKRDALKYQCYDREDCKNQPEVLFDLDTDPGETCNQINDPAYSETVASFRARASQLGFGKDGDPDYRNAGYPTD